MAALSRRHRRSASRGCALAARLFPRCARAPAPRRPWDRGAAARTDGRVPQSDYSKDFCHPTPEDSSRREDPRIGEAPRAAPRRSWPVRGRRWLLCLTSPD